MLTVQVVTPLPPARTHTQRNMIQNAKILDLLLGENKLSSQHKQALRCGRSLGHFAQIKLVCIKQALCVHSSVNWSL